MYKILINALLMNDQYSGVEYSTEYLIDALANKKNYDYQFTVLVSQGYHGILRNNKNLVIKDVLFDTRNRWKRIFYENFILWAFFKKGGFNLYHSTAYTLPLFFNFPSVVTIHDLIALDFPHLSKKHTVFYYGIFIPFAVRKAKKIIAVSNTVKNDIIRKFSNCNPQKIEMIYHGIHKRFTPVKNNLIINAAKVKYDLPANYLLFVGNIEPKKNIYTILKAFDQLKKTHKILQKLVIAGKCGWQYELVFEYIKRTGLDGDVIFLGYVDEQDIPTLYSMADILLFPSLYEGFGLPVLEAMACGCPVIISDRGALPEISGGICRKIDPFSIIELQQAILAVLTNTYKDTVITKGINWSKQFTWDLAATQTLNIYADCIK